MTQDKLPTSPVPLNSGESPSDVSWEIEDIEDEGMSSPRSLPSLWAPLWWYRLFRRFRKRKPRAIEEWLAYYEGRYSSRAPDSSVFKTLLARNGCWDIGCPFVPGSRQASDFCHDGVFMADIHFLLDRWLVHVMEGGWGFFQSPPHDALAGKDEENPYLNDDAPLPEKMSSRFPLWATNYSPIHYQQAMENRAEEVNNLRWAIEASLTLVALFLDSPSQWSWLMGRLHPDNRALLSTVVYEAAPSHQRSRLVKAWVKNGWISKSSSEKMVEVLSGKPPPQPIQPRITSN